MKLTDREARILAATYLRGDLSMSALARLTKQQMHTVRYAVDALESRGVLLQRAALIDPHTLGFNDFTLYIGGTSASLRDPKGLARRLGTIPEVSWIAELGGEYQLLVSILAPDAVRAGRVLDKLTTLEPSLFASTELSVRISLSIYGRRYFAPQITQKPVSIGEGPPARLDKTDLDLIHVVASGRSLIADTIARELQTSPSTVLRRLERLRAQGVIPCILFRQDVSRYGISSYRLLLETRGRTAKLTEQLRTFAAGEPQVTHLIEALGRAPYELVLESAELETLRKIQGALYATLGSNLLRVRLLHNFKSLLYRPFPTERIDAD